MSERTEPPSPKKIRDAREKGQFLFSREIVSGALLAAISAVGFMLYPLFIERVRIMVETALDEAAGPFDQAFSQIISAVITFALSVLGPIMGVAVLVAIIANVIQTGPVFSFAKLTKGMQAVNFISNAKQLVSKRSLFNFGLSLAKLLIIGYVVFLLLLSYLGQFVLGVNCGLACMMPLAGHALGDMFLILAALAIPVALIDFILQRHFYMKELRMTKEEVKQEYKEMEGNPEIKAQRRGMHQELLQEQAMEGVRGASAVVKNPTHYAVALFYDEEKTPLPIVTAKGEGALAQAMLEVAEREGVPVYENVDLAQGLFHDIEEGHYINAQFIGPVAAMLQFLEQQKAMGLL